MIDPDAEAQELLDESLAEEASRLLPSLREKKVDPWVTKMVAGILSGRAMSAGPTRGGENVQVRFRVGAKVVASSHLLSNLRDESLNWVPKGRMVSILTPGVFGTVVRSYGIEESLRDELRGDLLSFLAKRPDLTSHLSVVQYRARAGFFSEVSRAAHGVIVSMQIRSRIAQAEGVMDRVAWLSGEAADLVASVPYALFPDARRKLGHATARKALLKAVVKAMGAGLSDADIDSVKNEALVRHIMS